MSEVVAQGLALMSFENLQGFSRVWPLSLWRIFSLYPNLPICSSQRLHLVVYLNTPESSWCCLLSNSPSSIDKRFSPKSFSSPGWASLVPSVSFSDIIHSSPTTVLVASAGLAPVCLYLALGGSQLHTVARCGVRCAKQRRVTASLGFLTKHLRVQLGMQLDSVVTRAWCCSMDNLLSTQTLGSSSAKLLSSCSVPRLECWTSLFCSRCRSLLNIM